MGLENYPSRIKPREKAFSNGVESLSDVELLAIILRTGTKKKDVLSLADSLLDKIGCLSNLSEVTIQQLLEFKGIGQVKALELMAVVQLSKRINQININKFIYVNNPDVIYDLYKKRFEFVNQEHFVILSLNSKNALIDEHVAFIGTLSQSLVHPRDIFKRIVMVSASSFICLHNHPSGEAAPSSNDIEITEHLNNAAHLFGIPLLDHIIIGKNQYYSFKEKGYL